MSRFIAFLLLPVLVSCMSENNETTNIKKAIPMLWDESQLVDEPYGLDFSIEKLENNAYNLEIAIDIEAGSYFVSPHSKGSYMGRFSILIENNDELIMADTLLEIPRSVESIDPWTNNLASIVRQNTVYKQQFDLENEEDFEIEGLVQFVIEPKCTLEKIKFMISNHSGKLEVKRIRE